MHCLGTIQHFAVYQAAQSIFFTSDLNLGGWDSNWKSAMKPYAGFSKWGIPKTMGFNFNTKIV